MRRLLTRVFRVPGFRGEGTPLGYGTGTVSYGVGVATVPPNP